MTRKAIVAGLVSLLIILTVPLTSFGATSFKDTFLFGDHKYLYDINSESIFIVGGVETFNAPGDPPNFTVYMWNAPTASFDHGINSNGDIYLRYSPGWGNIFVEAFPMTDAWMERDIAFWADDNGNGDLDKGETSIVRRIPAGDLLTDGLPLVQNVTISGDSYHPTISWTYTESEDWADGFLVRLFPIGSDGLADVSQAPLFQSEWIPEDGSASYSYHYTGGLFQDYNKLAFAIEARDNISFENYGLVNRSRYIVNHVVPIPSTLFLLGGGLVGLFGIRRRIKRS